MASTYPSSATLTRVWHPFADMRAVVAEELVLDRGEGVWIWDEDGRQYLDGTAGLWFCNVGYGRKELASAAAEQMAKLHAYSAYGSLVTRPLRELAFRVADLAPLEDGVVFFTSGGSDAIDSAAKLVRRYWTAVDEPRSVIVVRDGAYHGMNGFGTSFAGIEANRAGLGDLLGSVVVVPRDDADAFARVAEARPGKIAAFFGEPVVGAGGIFPPQDGYWPAIRRICDETGALLVADEVITGFGRLGSWFACQRYGFEPDLMTVAKGITSGYMPLGAVICGRRVAEPFWAGDAGVFRHGYTYSGHAAACAVGLANLDLLVREDLVDHVHRIEPFFAQQAESLASHPLVKEVRCVGLLAGVGLDEAALAEQPDLADRVVEFARQQGLLLRSLLGHSLQISPSLVIQEDEVTTLVERAREALDLASV